MVCSELRAGVDFLCSSDRGGLPGETSCGHLGDPEIWDEGSGGNAGASRTRSGIYAGTRASHSQQLARLERSAAPEYAFQVCARFQSGLQGLYLQTLP